MSTVAYADGVMAGDKQMAFHQTAVTKIRATPDGGMIGYTGSSISKGNVLMEALVGEIDEVDEMILQDHEFNILAVDHNGDVYLYINTLQPVKLEPRPLYFAVGSGSDYAMGAMAMHASPELAVRIASRFDHATGQGVDTLSFSIPNPEMHTLN